MAYLFHKCYHYYDCVIVCNSVLWMPIVHCPFCENVAYIVHNFKSLRMPHRSIDITSFLSESIFRLYIVALFLSKNKNSSNVYLVLQVHPYIWWKYYLWPYINVRFIFFPRVSSLVNSIDKSELEISVAQTICRWSHSAFTVVLIY